MTPAGLTVEGAGPDLLSELLDAYAFELQRAGGAPFESMRPGESRQKIVETFARLGISVPEELLVWWMWRNGHEPGTAHGLRNAQIDLERAALLYELDASRDFDLLPGPNWLRVAGEPMASAVIVSLEETAQPPIVRHADPVRINAPIPLSYGQVVSLCTPITWWLTGIARGWTRFDPLSGYWHLEDEAGIPLEWRLTELI